jgi:hypothetical protein
LKYEYDMWSLNEWSYVMVRSFENCDCNGT